MTDQRRYVLAFRCKAQDLQTELRKAAIQANIKEA